MHKLIFAIKSSFFVQLKQQFISYRRKDIFFMSNSLKIARIILRIQIFLLTMRQRSSFIKARCFVWVFLSNCWRFFCFFLFCSFTSNFESDLSSIFMIWRNWLNSESRIDIATFFFCIIRNEIIWTRQNDRIFSRHDQLVASMLAC